MLKSMKLVKLADTYKMFSCMNVFSRVIFELILVIVLKHVRVFGTDFTVKRVA